MTALVLSIGVVTVVTFFGSVGRASPTSARESLRSARSFAARASSVSYDTRLLLSAPDFRGDVSSALVVGHVSAVFPDRARIFEHLERTTVETLVVGRTVYVREAEYPDPLRRRKWIELSLGRAELDSRRLDGPDQIRELFSGAGRARLVNRIGSNTTVRFAVSSRALGLPGVVSRAGSIHGVMTIAEDGRPVHLTLEMSRGRTSLRMRLEHLRWNHRVRIAAPAKSRIDATPGIEEEQIADFDDVPVYQPAAIPRGWVLEQADVRSPNETEERCYEVYLSYANSRASPIDGGYLDLSQFAPSCSLGRPAESEELVTGSNRGFITADSEGTRGELRVGSTVIQFDSDLPSGVVAGLLASLVPLDLSKQPGRVPSETIT